MRSKHFWKELCKENLYISWRSTTFMLEVSLESWWKVCLKIWKNMKFPTLRKISKFRNFNFSKWNLEFLFSWWISFIFFHALMNCDLWYLILTKKSKFDFLVYSWLFDQLTANFICQSNGFAMFWTMSLGHDDSIEPLESCFKSIGHFLGQKSEITLS